MSSQLYGHQVCCSGGPTTSQYWQSWFFSLILTFRSGLIEFVSYDRLVNQCLDIFVRHSTRFSNYTWFIYYRWNLVCKAEFSNLRLASSVDLKHTAVCPAHEARFKSGSYHMCLIISAEAIAYASFMIIISKKQKHASATQSRTTQCSLLEDIKHSEQITLARQGMEGGGTSCSWNHDNCVIVSCTSVPLGFFYGSTWNSQWTFRKLYFSSIDFFAA